MRQEYPTFKRSTQSYHSVCLFICVVLMTTIHPCYSQNSFTNIGDLLSKINIIIPDIPNCSLINAGVCLKCSQNFDLVGGKCISTSGSPTSPIVVPPPTSGTINVSPQLGSPIVVVPFNPQNSGNFIPVLSNPQQTSYLESVPKNIPTNKNLPCAPKPFCG